MNARSIFRETNVRSYWAVHGVCDTFKVEAAFFLRTKLTNKLTRVLAYTRAKFTAMQNTSMNACSKFIQPNV